MANTLVSASNVAMDGNINGNGNGSGSGSGSGNADMISIPISVHSLPSAVYRWGTGSQPPPARFAGVRCSVPGRGQMVAMLSGAYSPLQVDY